jgi:hypothetical protein
LKSGERTIFIAYGWSFSKSLKLLVRLTLGWDCWVGVLLAKFGVLAKNCHWHCISLSWLVFAEALHLA